MAPLAFTVNVPLPSTVVLRMIAFVSVMEILLVPVTLRPTVLKLFPAFVSVIFPVVLPINEETLATTAPVCVMFPSARTCNVGDVDVPNVSGVEL
jgi:hypothetical protein